MNLRFLDALHCRNRGRPPLWLMRQAGRYLPEYQLLRAAHSFETLCHTPELIAETTCTPFKRFSFDAAILFSDILLITEAIDKVFHFHEGKGPVLNAPLRSARDVEALSSWDLKPLECVIEGIKLVLPRLNVPLIGFCGGPFTVASYLIEGGSSRDFHKTTQWIKQDPESFHSLLQLLTTMHIAYLQMQVQAGVAAIQIFDSWANVLPESQFLEFAFSYLQQIIQAIHPQVPVILFCRHAPLLAKMHATIQASCLSLDATCHLADMRLKLGPHIALQGNLDPKLFATHNAETKKRTQEMLQSMKNDQGYICNLGHGILPETPLEAVENLIEAVHTI